MAEQSRRIRVQIAMNWCKAIYLILVLLLLSAVTLNVYADSVHKWVDAQGVTHYSDQLPEIMPGASPDKNNNSVKQIDVSNTYSNSGRNSGYQDDYYSVTNQWARMREERLERKQLQLEKVKQKAALQPAVPQVVYVNQAKNDRPRNYYPAYGFGHIGYGHRFHKKYNHYAGMNYGSTCRLPNPNFSRGYARSGNSRSVSSGLTLSVR
jgi:hypothetical protein